MSKTRKKRGATRPSRRIRHLKGGKVLASGGFGCVFSPALKCEGAKQSPANSVTKLMTDKHAIQEYEEIQQIGAKLASIPRSKDYFLVFDASLCRPQKLTQQDLTRFSQTCSALPKNGITQENINQKLDQVLALTLPNGGLPVDDYMYACKSFAKLAHLHGHMVDLLRHGILPMNKKRVYHCDIKDSNILVAEQDNSNILQVRLIDWGLSHHYSPAQDAPFPKSWRNRPLQFNVPCSVVLFTDTFYQKYTDYLANGGTLDGPSLKPFLSDYLKAWMTERGAGHYKFINEIVFKVYSHEVTSVSEKSKPAYIETQVTLPLLIDYLEDVLTHYTKFKSNGDLNLREYLNNVFVHIVDVYGFVSSYYPLLEMLFDHIASLDANGEALFEAVANLFKRYMFAPRHAPYSMPALYKDLEHVGKCLENVARNEPSKGGAQFKGAKRTARMSKTKRRGAMTSVHLFRKKPNVKRFKHPIFLSLK